MKSISKTIKELLIILIISLGLQTNVFAKTIKENEIDGITAPNVMLLQTDTGKLLYEKNINEKIYPASITKLMTAIVVMENCDLDDIATVSENAVRSVPSGYVNANLQIGEKITVEDLMYAMLIPSANDAANALAEHVAGSIQSFSTMMNSKAKELGCTNSNFTNPSGLQEEEHYTTVKDLSLIARKAISNEIIKKIISTTKYTLKASNEYPKTDRILTTTNYMKRKELSKYYCNYCIGGKTGYTGDAKNCVIEFAEKDGIELIAIVMGESSKIKGQKFLESKKLFDYIYNNYENKNIAKKGDICESIKISNATKETKKLEVIYNNDINILEMKDINIDNIIEKKIEYTKNNAPIQKGEKIGNITYTYEGIEHKADLVAGQNVEESIMIKYVFMILLLILIIYIIYNLKKSNKKIRNKKRKAKRIYY